VGAKEVEGNSLSVRTRASGELGSMAVGQVIGKLENAIGSASELRSITSHENF